MEILYGNACRDVVILTVLHWFTQACWGELRVGDVADLALCDELGVSTKSLIQRHSMIVSLAVVKIDVISLQTI
jgi:hypothetical protein